MAFEPFPSKRNDPDWADFTDAHDLSRAPKPQPLVPPGIDVAAMIKLVEQTQRVQSAVLTPEQPKLPWWTKHHAAKTAYWCTLVPTLVTGCANISAHQWGVTGPAVTGGLLSAVMAGLGVVGLDHKWRSQGLAVMAAGVVGGASFSAAAAGTGWTEVMAWLATAGATLGFKLVWNRKHAADKAKVALTEAKVRTELAKGDAVKSKSAIVDALGLLRLQEAQRAATAPVGPALHSATQEEYALRCAVWDVFEVELHSCDVRRTRTGWTATVGLPVALPRNDARNAWHKVANAMRLDGRLKAVDGRLTNELVVSFVDNAAARLEPLTGWKPGDCWAIVADTGEEVPVPLGRRILFAGTSGSGKSWSARPLVAEASEYADHRLVLIDLKVTEARNWQHRARIAFDPDQVDTLTDELIIEGERRLKLIPRGRDTVEISPDLPRITVFVDEGGELISGVGEEQLDRLRTVARKYRAAEIILDWCTQKPSLTGSGHGLDSQISAQLTHKLSLAVGTPSESRVVFGEDAGEKGWDAHELPMPGWALLRDIESQSPPVKLRMRAMSPTDVISLDDRPVWHLDGDRSFSGDTQYRTLVDAASATPEERVAAFVADNPTASQRAVAEATGVPRATVQRLLKTL